MSLIFNRIAKVTAYRARAGKPGGFVASHPEFFQTLPNGIEILGGIVPGSNEPHARIKASVEKHTDKEPNTCKIVIYNCNEQTRTFLNEKPLTVRLEAGYDGTLNQLFIGNVRTAWPEFNGVSVEMHLELGDGDRAFRYAQMNHSYRKGTKIAVAVQQAALSLGLIIDARTLASPELQAEFAAGRTLSRATHKELTDLLTPYGFRWSIQDGRLVVLKDNQTLPDEALLISEDSGPMVGSPSFITPTKVGDPTLVKVKSKLYTQITAGARIAIRSRSIATSVFRVEKIGHELDTREGPWDSEIEGKAV